jgi:hypothetical protein
MKTILYCLLLLLLFTPSGYSQISIGPEAGLNFATQSNKMDGRSIGESKGITAARIGMVVNIPVSKKVHIQPGMFYSGKGRKEAAFDSTGMEGTFKDKLHYIEMPVNAVFQMDMGRLGGAFAAAGPYLGYAVGGKQKIDIEGRKQQSEKIFGSSSFYERLDYGLNFSIGFRSTAGFFLRLQYQLGLANIVNHDFDLITGRNRVLSLSLGYLFKTAK